jgi:hypothetical protein
MTRYLQGLLPIASLLLTYHVRLRARAAATEREGKT